MCAELMQNEQNRIDMVFSNLRAVNKKALITFVTAGDPDIETTEQIIYEMERNGAHIIEIGVPYSDPVAEGPVIQAANERALKNGTRISHIFDMVKRLRTKTHIPLVLLLYYNTILKYGEEKFFSTCKKSGIDAVIIPDLPYEEKEEIMPFSQKYGVYIIDLVSPVSGNRVKKIASHSKGFIYCISSTGVTGIRENYDTDFKAFMDMITSVSNVPAAIGFGISGSAHVKMLKNYADGVIVGSAIIKKIHECTDKKEAVRAAGIFVKELSQSLEQD